MIRTMMMILPNPATTVNYGLTIAPKGQDKLLEEFDVLLDKYTSFSLRKLTSIKTEEAKVLDDWVNDISGVFDAIENFGKNVMSTTSTVTIDLVSPGVAFGNFLEELKQARKAFELDEAIID
ncbi:hypothetical protein IFM89_006711 [Coptis chinensis]|uniref:Uncharacterized protein n=1 Tax=Coptis chinensis TaxID=261450 RepID=A0A835HBG0_9MAGN|nr:hypothetical protein IFM89_006711 [Coptis chinensis]